MILSIISFTENGKRLSEEIAAKLQTAAQTGDIRIQTVLHTKYAVDTKYAMDTTYTMDTECGARRAGAVPPPVSFVNISVGAWAGEQMREGNALMFIGACGIAVRAVAPFLTDKLHDVPVLVMDEKGSYVIPILSGHMGGANDLAHYLAKETGAEPVITTATDIRGKFAVDLFAKKNGLFIVNRDGIAKVSAKALAGKEITISVEPGCGTVRAVPGGVRFVPYPPAGAVDVVVTAKERGFDASIILKPKEYVIGMGCKKGKDANEIEALMIKKTKELGIAVSQIYALASISCKSDEAGLLAWCRKESVPFYTYTAEELQAVEGNFVKSAFVKAQVGVDNVCERAALRACGAGGELITAKYAKNGMTIAVAKRRLPELDFS